MKTAFILITAGIVLASCNNNNDSFVASGAKSDSSHSSTTTSGHVGAAHQDTAGMARGLMQSMSSSMAAMKKMQMSGDFDADYANTMIAHHQGALDMAQVELSQGREEKVKAIAQNIITKQTKEQQELSSFLQNYKGTTMKHGEGALQAALDSMAASMMKMPLGNTTDQDFLTMMIAHHEHGIAMDKLQVLHGMDDKLKAMAKKSMAEQQKEIKEMKALQSASNN
jgi:uncharacterized protein (DUF305 family)